MEIVFVEFQEKISGTDWPSDLGQWRLTHNDREITIHEWILRDEDGNEEIEQIDLHIEAWESDKIRDLTGSSYRELAGLFPALWESYATKKTVGFHF